MPMDARTTYAKSSDIKGRSYLEYRRDMKRKAIAELEMLIYLPEILKGELKTNKLTASKSGGDRFLWFLRKGGITREPDFIVATDTKTLEVEFQYAKKTDLDYYDFKISKVVKGKNKEPIKDKYFLYLHIPLEKYAFFNTNWIIDNGKYGMVEAWRSYAYRVPQEKMQNILKTHPCLKILIHNIEAKETLLHFQHKLLDMISENLSFLLQQIIDEKKILHIIPDNLDSIFQICFILDNINKVPKNINLWLIYLLTYVNGKITLSEIYKIVYCLDFLYSKIEVIKDNESNCIVTNIKRINEIIRQYYQNDGSYISTLKNSPYEETRYALFSINLLEDLTQDLIYNYNVTSLNPIKRIYESVINISKTYDFIRNVY